MKGKFSLLSSVITAIFASICCIGPLIIFALGLSGVGWLPTLAKFRPLFIVVTILLVFWSWRGVLKKGKCCEANSMKQKSMSREKIILLIITIVVIIILLFPYILEMIQKGG